MDRATDEQPAVITTGAIDSPLLEEANRFGTAVPAERVSGRNAIQFAQAAIFPWTTFGGHA